MVLPSYAVYVAKTLDITLRGSTISRIPKLPQPVGSPSLVPVSRPSPPRPARPLTPVCPVLLCTPRLVVLGRPNMHKKTPWKMVKMAPIYDFPRAARAEHGHGAKKVLAGVRFQWTDTQNDICIGRADKFSGWEPLLEPSKPLLLLFERGGPLR